MGELNISDIDMFLFTVEESFMVTGVGLVLAPGPGDNTVKAGDKIQITRPDGSVVETTIHSVAFHSTRAISVGDGFRKADIPVGSNIELYQMK